MSWPQYLAYADNGVPWLDKYPSGWVASPLKFLADMRSGESITSESITPTGHFPVYGGNGLRGYTAAYTHQGARVLVGRQGALCGNIHLVSGKYWASEHAIVTTPAKGIDPRWLAHVLDTMNLRQYSQAAAQPGISAEAIGKLRVPTPSPSEQACIADFLDRETAKIDALIAKQEQLIATLREDRTATITQAVTKGLDGDAQLTATSSRWIDSTPMHWRVVQVKRVASRITDGAHISPETEGGVFDFVSTKDITDVAIDFAGALKTSPASYQYLVRNGCKPEVGDVLFSKDGTIGRTVVVIEDRDFVVASSLIIIKPNHHLVTPQYLHYSCQAANGKQQVESFVKGAGLPRLSIANLRRVFIAVPPVAEQAKIAEFLGDRCGKIDSLIAQAQEVTGNLHEYRSALITDAVTGKIDVRGAA
jgi:type I restriction enzyme S subunit